jgi:polysaccharide biosynthesis/export protein ExoF
MRSISKTSVISALPSGRPSRRPEPFQRIWNVCVILLAVSVLPLFWTQPTRAASELPAGDRGGQDIDTTKGVLQPSPSPESYPLDTGDQLRIRFYDRYDRDDLNGVYVIGESGELRLPRIGSFNVRTKTVAQFEREIRQAVNTRGEKLGYFSVDIARCRPFYIVGPVERPGAYPFSPGLTVLHAITLSGGFLRSPLGDKVSLTENLSRQAALIARRARLRAENDGSQLIPIPDELFQLEPTKAAEMIARELKILEQTQQISSREKSMSENLVKLNQDQAENYRQDLVRIERRLAEQTQIYTQLKYLHESKVINQQRFFEAVTALDSLQRDKIAASVNHTQAATNLEKAQRDLAVFKLSESARIAKEINETELELARLRKIASQTRGFASEENGLGLIARYKIVRHNNAGRTDVVQAGETTPIIPGDIIKIEARAESEGSY